LGVLERGGAQRVGTDAHAIVVAARARERGDEGVGEAVRQHAAEVLGLFGIAERCDLDRVRAGGDVAGRRRARRAGGEAGGAATGTASGAAATTIVGPSTSMRTRTVPGPTMPIVRRGAIREVDSAPVDERPRSLTRTCTARPFSRLVTMTRVPSGSEGCAAVSSYWS